MTVFTACASGAASVADRTASPNVVNATEGEEEYELLIMDNGFRTWFTTYAKPITYHSPAYYANANQRYVSEWNQKVGQQGMYRGDYPFTQHIDYDLGVEYGVKLDYELYWYFRYVEALYGRRYNFGYTSR